MNALRFFRAVYHDNNIRKQNRRRLRKDLMLYARNRALRPVDRVLARVWADPTVPVGFVVGAPRSGTTLLFQLISQHLEVSYPSNALARFWISPVAGAVITDLRDRDGVNDGPLRSHFGGTEGARSPHEFSWFWHWYTAFQAEDDRTDAELDAVDWARLRREIAGLAGRRSRPFVFKSLNWTVYNIDRFARELPQSRYIYIRRDPRFVVQSILECRVRRYGDENTWWTIRPRDVDAWLDKPPLEQVCHQVADIWRGIDEGLAGLPDDRKLVLDYEDLVARPAETLHEVAAVLGARVRDPAKLDALTLTNGNAQRLEDDRFHRIQALIGGPRDA